MTPTQFQRVRELFDEAGGVEASSIAAWVAGRVPNDPEVAAELVSLLEADANAGEFLSASVASRMPQLLDDEGIEAGTAVGPYRIVRELGRGGMGRVYLATDERLGRRVALKALPPALTQDPGQRERLRREARAAALLSHPGICTVFALEEIDGDLFIASELIEGESLRAEISHGHRPTAKAMNDVARELASALAAAHASGVTHRDLKPENVMRSSAGQLKILDFGLALVAAPVDASAAARVTKPGAIIGTPAYMSPEQLRGKDADARSDLFALGLVLYELATGLHPFEAETPLATTARVLEGQPRPLEQLRPDLAPSLVHVIKRCLNKSPSDRFGSAQELLGALHAGGAPVRSVATWWRIHQAVALGLYVVAVTVAWRIKEWTHGPADPLFLVLGVVAMVGGVFRGHMLFTERMNHDSFAAERRRAAPVTLAVDLAVALVLGANGLLIASGRPVAAVLTLALAVAIALVRLVVEPATTTGAFGAAGTFGTSTL